MQSMLLKVNKKEGRKGEGEEAMAETVSVIPVVINGLP